MPTFDATVQPHEAPLVDTHLVMNALNQLVALDASGGGLGSPLIFTLSDYLREALASLESQEHAVSQESALLSAHVHLMARVARQSFDLQEPEIPEADPWLPRAALSHVAALFLKQLRNLRECRMQVRIDPAAGAPEAQWLRGSMTIASPTRIDGLDGVAIQRKIAESPPTRGAEVSVDSVSVTSADSGTQATLFFRARLSPPRTAPSE